MSETTLAQLAPPHQPGALTQIESSRAVQEVQAALVISKRFPRDERAALDRILNACTRPGLANAAVYQYARGGSDISGPSIRLAETIAQNWGNLQFGIRELEQTDGESTVEAFCWDTESNTRQTKIFQVPHLRYRRADKGGSVKLDDPRDVYELIANQGARRLRACILGIIPGDVIESALQQCETTMAADADTSPEAQKKIIAAFEKYGVKKEQIEAKIQRRMDSITPAQVVNLRKIMASLKDGMSQASEWFGMPVKEANVPLPPPEKKTVKKSSPPPSSDLPLNDDRLTAAQVIRQKMESSGMAWSDIQRWSEANGEPLQDTPERTDELMLQSILQHWDSITL
jgi:hypothetical protein